MTEMSQSVVSVYIPYVGKVSSGVHRTLGMGQGPGPGGVGKLKRYISKAFAKPDTNGAMVLGTVKKVDIVIGKRPHTHTTTTTEIASMEMDDDVDRGRTGVASASASAFVKFVPSGTKACLRLLDEINSDNGLRFVHNTNKLLFWNIHRQRKEVKVGGGVGVGVAEKSCPMCGRVVKAGEKRGATVDVDDIMYALEGLSCDDGRPGAKRMRTGVRMSRG